jgi:ribulose-bisphosphate carboxylase large chain
MEPLRATYRLRVEPARARERAEALALEQTVELPREAVRDSFVEREILPEVEGVDPDPDGGARVRVAFPLATTGLEPSQLLNVLFGNSSLEEDVELLDVLLPGELLRALGGPRFGIEGLRKKVGAFDRPLTCTALKPMGLAPEALAELCYRFARAGVDLVKDDHGLADQDFCPFDARVRACQAAVERAASETGHRAVYAPNLSGSLARIERQLAGVREVGAGAVLASPMLIGLPSFLELAREARVPVLAHPALAGASRIAPAALLGRIFRALGADAVIYPHAGGRFSYSPAVCRAIAERLREPLGGIRASLPVPAGGIRVERVEEVVTFYGSDVMLLIGGSLYLAGPPLEERTRAFVRRAREAAARGPTEESP